MPAPGQKGGSPLCVRGFFWVSAHLSAREAIGLARPQWGLAPALTAPGRRPTQESENH